MRAWPIALVGLAVGAHCAVAAEAPRLVRDMTGRKVSLPATPTRIVSLCLSATDTLLRMGQAGRLAGVDEYGALAPGTGRVPVVARGGAIAIESIVGAGADLAFVWWYQEEPARLLAARRVPVVRLRSPRAAEVPDMIRLIGSCVGMPEAAADLARPVEAFLAAPRGTEADADAPRVFLELYGPYKTAGRGTFLDDLIALAGGRNIAEGGGHVVLSAEAVVGADPAVVLLAGARPEDFVRRPGMRGTAAARAGRVWSLDRNLSVAGAGLPDSVARLRELLRKPGAAGDSQHAVP